MNFKPKTEKELAEDGLIPEGVYPFLCINALDTKSKTSGADMIAIQVRIYGPDGREPVIKDYLLESYLRKIFNFAKVTGRSAQYHAGSLCANDCTAAEGFAKVGVERGNPKKDAGGNPTGEFYPDKNVIKDYVSQPSGAPSAPRPGPTEAQMANTAPKHGVPTTPEEDVPF